MHPIEIIFRKHYVPSDIITYLCSTEPFIILLQIYWMLLNGFSHRTEQNFHRTLGSLKVWFRLSLLFPRWREKQGWLSITLAEVCFHFKYGHPQTMYRYVKCKTIFIHLSEALFAHPTGLSGTQSHSSQSQLSASEPRDVLRSHRWQRDSVPRPALASKSHRRWRQVRKRKREDLALPAGPYSTFNKRAKKEPLNNIVFQWPQPRNRECSRVAAAQPLSARSSHPGRSNKPSQVSPSLPPSHRYN